MVTLFSILTGISVVLVLFLFFYSNRRLRVFPEDYVAPKWISPATIISFTLVAIFVALTVFYLTGDGYLAFASAFTLPTLIFFLLLAFKGIP